jgi:hypothetical protein
VLEIHHTPGRKNHQEEAKLWHLCTSSLHIASPRHVTRRNQEGSCAARHRLLTCLADADQQSYYSNTNTTTGRWKSNTRNRTIKTETLLHLNLGFFFFCSFSVYLMPV